MVGNTNIPITSTLLEKKLFLKTASLQWVIISVLVEHPPSFSSFHHSIKSWQVTHTDADLRVFQLLLVFIVSELQKIVSIKLNGQA